MGEGGGGKGGEGGDDLDDVGALRVHVDVFKAHQEQANLVLDLELTSLH